MDGILLLGIAALALSGKSAPSQTPPGNAPGGVQYTGNDPTVKEWVDAANQLGSAVGKIADAVKSWK